MPATRELLELLRTQLRTDWNHHDEATILALLIAALALVHGLETEADASTTITSAPPVARRPRLGAWSSPRSCNDPP